MSWIERLNNVKFAIQTGDGKVFTPLWKNGVKTKDYNVSSYNFIDVAGGFTDRKKPQASKFPLVFWFQGDDNIDQADAFEASADDPRSWTVKHPLYGNITGQPLSLKRDDLAYNTTEISVDFWESINEDYPNPEKSIDDIIIAKTENVAETNAESYESRLKATSADQQIIQDNIVQMTSSFDKLFDDSNYSEYQNLISTAKNAAGNLIAAPRTAIDSTHALLLQPSTFSKPVLSRVKSLINAYIKIKETLEEFNTVNTKIYFESQGAVCLAAMCQATSTPIDSDYITRVEIEEITSLITENYAEYLEILDNSQININDVQNTFHASAVAQFDLYELIVETTGNLFSLAFQAKQQRIVETEKETNLILLTHRFLGLDADDENIEQFRELNNIKNNELFRIKKGREIKYLV